MKDLVVSLVKSSSARLRSCPAVVVTFVLLASSVYAQGPAPSPISSPASSPLPLAKAIEVPEKPHSLTRDDLEAFLDGLIPSQLENRNIAGAVVGAVKDGEVLLTKGYGYADYANKKPVVASSTLFRPGSISKLFTTIAVMQLVEQGKLDLDRDVNQYVDFPIAKGYAEPVTLRRILTHTAGFEETLKNLFVADARSMRPLRDYLVASMPARVFPPGKVPSYSNWAVSLAGYIVQRTSGEQFESYVGTHILQPLKMERSTFVQPLPPELREQMSNGYRFGTEKALPFEFVQAAPAGALSATADDICRLLLAFLGNGTVEGATILKPESLQQIESRQFEVNPDLNAIGLILMQYDMNGLAAWGHGGDTIAFHSDLWFVPDAHFGFFISYNSAGKSGGGRGEVQRAIFDRYFTGHPPEIAAVAADVARADARAVAGTYISSRRSETTFLKSAALLGEIAVGANADGTISIDSAKNLRGQLKRWRETAPLVYHEVDGPDKISFRRAPNGRVTDLLIQPPIVEAQRTTWYESKKFLLPFVGASLVIIVLTALLWPVAAIVRRRYKTRLFADAGLSRTFVFGRIACVVVLAWLVLLAILGTRATADISLLGNAINPWLQALHVLGWLAVIGTIWLIYATIRFWQANGVGLWLRLHSTIVTAAMLVFVWFAWHTHFLDASLKF